MSEERVLSALRALAESNRDQQAPPELEAKLVAAFAGSRRMRRWRRAGLGAIAAAAAVIVVAAVPNPWRLSETPARKTAVVDAPRPQTESAQIETAEATQDREIVAAPPRKTAGRVAGARVQKAGGLPVPEEVATDFFPLMDVAPPFGRGEIVRITVPAAAMQSVGLPVREERLGEPIQADVLLGEEGMPRAIRFVNFTH